ncbi:hypothetical protein SK128_023429 [Halocaridina rubra]|uniref:Uncharacterized protein n=1 Tax=Halocaridina rubra TaxID=373956 RepID=A0AAN8WPB9_HALRR
MRLLGECRRQISSMPPQKQVHKLQDFARDKVLYNVCAVILNEIFYSQETNWNVYSSTNLSSKLELVKEFLSTSLTPGILEELLNTILTRDEEVDVLVRYLAMQLLLVPGVRSLSVGNFPESYYNMILDVIAKNGESIHQLDLRGIWVNQEHKGALLRVLRKLSEVRKLTLRYICDDEVLSTLGKYASNLQRIDMSGSRGITEEGLRNLCANPHRICMDKLKYTLQIVDLGGPGAQNLPPSHVKYLMLYLPNLVSVGSYEKTGQAVQLIYDDYPTKVLGLLYMHDLTTTSGRYHAIMKVCPDLQAVYFDSPKDTVVHYLDMLKKLNEIKLHKVRWSDAEILLKKMGTRIRSLYLLTVFGDIDLLNLGSWCSDLRRLEFHNVYLRCEDTTHPNAFHKVLEFLIYSSHLSTTSVKFILNQCVMAEKISICDCEHLDDASVRSCILGKSLRQVKELWLGAAENLTIQSVESLMENCPALTDLGNLATWSVHPDDLDILRVQLLVTNTDLTLHELASPGDDEWIVIG